MRIKSWLAGAAVAVAASAAMAAGAATPAAAGDYNGSCEGGEVCVYYYTNFGGPVADFYNNVSNYNNWHFYNSSYWLANNNESARNKAVYSCVEFFNLANYSGPAGFMASESEKADFGADKNKAESHKFDSDFPHPCAW